MTRANTPAQFREWQARWQLVNQAEIEELRQTPAHVKLRQLAALMASVDQMGWSEALEAENAAARERWKRLRQAYGV